MSVKISSVGKVPNWISENDWSNKDRLHWMSIIMTTSPRDWSKYPYAIPCYPDPESWAIYILVNSDTKEEALQSWTSFCNTCKM